MRYNYRKNYLELVFLYLKFRNFFNFGFQKYAVFKKIIVYITEISNSSFIRYIFTELLEEGYIEKKIILGSLHYRFNPYKKNDPEISSIIAFE